MAISVTHAHVSEVPDDPSFDVSSGEWNAAHAITGAAEAYQATSFPGSPTEGLLCYRTDRHVLYQYDGTSWVPVISYAALTLYVDPTGTDDDTHGWASGTDAYATITHALSQVPPLYGGNVTVNIAAGTYTENVVVQGKGPVGPYSLTLQGTLTEQVSTTMNSGVKGTQAGATQPSVTKTAAGWTTDAYKRMLCKFTSGGNDGLYRVIETNNSTTLTLVGRILTAAPGSGDSFKIYSHGTIISGTFSSYCSVYVNDISVTDTTTIGSGPHSFARCKFQKVMWGGAIAHPTLMALDICSAAATSGQTTDAQACLGRLAITNSYITTGSGNIALLSRYGVNTLVGSCVLASDGGAAANGIILCRGYIEIWNSVPLGDTKTFIKSTSGTGVLANYGGLFVTTATCSFASVSTPSAEDADTYSKVQTT